MVFLSNKIGNNKSNKEDNMNTDTTTVPVSSVEDLERKISLLESRLNNVSARENAFIRIIEGLPWGDINTGNFRPEAGCGDVATARQEFISLGCEHEVLSEGLDKAYYVYASVPVEVKIYVEAANSEEEAERQAEDILSCSYFEARDIEDVEFSTYDADFHTIEEA